MKFAIAIVLVIFSVTGFAWYADYQAQKQREIAEGWVDIQIHQDAHTAAMNSELFRLRVNSVRIHYGQATALEYELCKTAQPTQPKNIKRCKQLVPKIEREEAQWDATHKW